MISVIIGSGFSFHHLPAARSRGSNGQATMDVIPGDERRHGPEQMPGLFQNRGGGILVTLHGISTTR